MHRHPAVDHLAYPSLSFPPHASSEASPQPVHAIKPASSLVRPMCLPLCAVNSKCCPVPGILPKPIPIINVGVAILCIPSRSGFTTFPFCFTLLSPHVLLGTHLPIYSSPPPVQCPQYRDNLIRLRPFGSTERPCHQAIFPPARQAP